jgi:hypothetical protein
LRQWQFPPKNQSSSLVSIHLSPFTWRVKEKPKKPKFLFLLSLLPLMDFQRLPKRKEN